MDLAYPSDLSRAVLRGLLARVMECARIDGAEIFECQSSDAQLLQALPRDLFAGTAPGVRFLYRRAGAGACPSIPVDRWRLYAGDCDLDALGGRGPAP